MYLSLSLGEEIELADDRRIVILDDDPTGSQTVSDVEVILQPSVEAFRRFFRTTEKSVYVLTNTRSMPVEQAVALVRRICSEIELAAIETGQQVSFILRGDSTLRGHVFAEVDVFSLPTSVCLFVPAFPEGGRVTVQGIHYLDSGQGRVPVVRTEFAKDAVFGYTSERIIDWVAEVGGGRAAKSIPLHEIREWGASCVTEALLEALPGTVLIPDAETIQDLEIISSGLIAAEERGVKVVTRSASTFAAIRAGLNPPPVQLKEAEHPRRVLLVCGSHTAASTRQLKLVSQNHANLTIISTEPLLREDSSKQPAEQLACQISEQLNRSGFAILATERTREAVHEGLSAGAKVMSAITDIVRLISSDVDAVIAKGGITSAEVATIGLSATSARVCGQLEPGVSLWQLPLPDGRTIPYAVVPGNVGNDNTLKETLSKFGIHV